VCKQLRYLNSYAIYQFVSFPMTLNEPYRAYPVFEVRPFFDAKCITNGYRYGASVTI